MIIICDLDGTLFNIQHRLHHIAKHNNDGTKRKRDWVAFEGAVLQDTPNKAVVEIVVSMHRAGHTIVFVSGRHERTRQSSNYMIRQALGVLGQHTPDNTLYMRRDDDNRADYTVKQEIFDIYFSGDRAKDILFCLDDRQQVVDMWRRNGLTCLQVAEGNF